MNKFCSISLLMLVLVSVSLYAESSNQLNYGFSFQHQSKQFNSKRRYFVSLPERYQLEQEHYPSLYIIDGDFQFHHVANTVRHLARMGKIPPMIVIGVANQGPSDYLKSNTWPSSESDEFGGIEIFKRYLYQELVPAIDSKYRTNNKRALAGYSLGGLTVLQSYLDEQTPFSAFLAMSPSIWYDQYQMVNQFKQAINTKNLQAPLFVSLANEEGMGVTELVQVLESAKTKVSHWQYKHYPNETHYSTALPALYDGLQFLAPNYFVDAGRLMAEPNYLSALALFDQTARTEQHSKPWAESRLGWLQSYTFAKYVFASKQHDQIDQILAQIKEKQSDSYLRVVRNLALGFNRKQMYFQAKKLLMTIKAQSKNSPHWHYQLSVSEQGLNNDIAAKEAHAKAITLGLKYKLESWEMWEMEMDKYDH